MNKLVAIYVYLFFLIIETSCSTSRKQANQGAQYFYQPENNQTFYTQSDDPNASILYVSETFLLIARFSKPYAAIIRPDFAPSSVSDDILNSIYEAKIVYFQNDNDEVKPSMKFNIPSWINNFKDLQVLRIGKLELNDLQNQNRLKIKHLIVSSLKSGKRVRVSQLVDLQELKYLVYSHIDLIEDLSLIRATAPDVKFLKEKDYNKMLDSGKIVMVE